MHKVDIRKSAPGDVAALEALYSSAFPEEDLLALLRDLLAERDDVLSLVAGIEGEVAGHVVFSTCGVSGAKGMVSLLGPLAVTPARQRRGIGMALIREGLRRVTAAGADKAIVLGDPNYYARSGFEIEARVTAPYPLPADWREAWRSIDLRETGALLEGRLTPPSPWLKQVYWAP